MKRDPISHLAAVTLARHAELSQEKPNEAVIAVCDMFMADAVRDAAGASQFIVKSQPKEN